MRIQEQEWVDDENIYGEGSAEMLLEDDELSPEEEGFMIGYMEAGQMFDFKRDIHTEELIEELLFMDVVDESIPEEIIRIAM